MKKTNRVVAFVLIILVAMAGFSCKVGLGPQIDILPPIGTIDYPEMGETPIRGSFLLRGEASDDDGIVAIEVSFKNIVTQKEIEGYKATGFTEGDRKVSWKVEIPNESTGTKEGHELVKVYPIPDGEYTAIVTVTDKGGKKSQFTKNYKIDNTPPVFIVDRPSTVIINNDNTVQADPYGAVFTVKGAANDKHTIADLTLKVAGTEIHISKPFVGETISEELATATSGDELYDYNEKAGKPKIKAHLLLTDNACFRKGDGNVGKGNTSEWYYVRDKDMRSVLEKGYTPAVINDYFSGKEGDAKSADRTQQLLAALYDDTNEEGKSVRQILKDARVMTDGTDAKFSVFTLDPNRSPGFKVTNANHLASSFPADTLDSSLPKAGVLFFSPTVAPEVLIELIPNKNGTELVQEKNYDAYRASGIVVNMYKCNAPSYVTSGNKKILQLVPAASPSYSLKFENLSAQDQANDVVTLGSDSRLNVKWHLPNPRTFASGYYIIQVEGNDIEHNDFIAYGKNNSPGGFFVVNYTLAGGDFMIVPSDPSEIIKEDFNVIANVSSSLPVTEVRYKFDAEAGENDTLLTNSSGTTEWKTSAPISISSVGAEGAHKVYFWAKNSANKTVTAHISFTKDTQAPVPEFKYPDANAELAGTIRIMGNVTDAHAGVNKNGTKYIIGKQSPNPTASSLDWKTMDKSSVAAWEFMYNLDNFASNPSAYGTEVSGKPGVYDIPVYILTEDTVGNKAVTTFTVRYDSDGDKPIITVLAPQSDQPLGGTIRIFGTAATRVNGPVDVGKVYIQFSKSGAFNSAEDGTFGGYTAADGSAIPSKDWYNGGIGQLVPNTDTKGGASWLISINEDASFNNPSGDNWKIYFRLRAENKTNGTRGVWSDPIGISIDKDYPTIGSPNPLQVVNADGSSGGEASYSSGMWISDGKKLTGSLFDDSGIKQVTLSSLELWGSKKYTLRQALADGLIVEDTAHASSSSNAKNYTLHIPLKLSELSDAVKRKGEITISIRIVENTEKELAREETLQFHFDITKPVGGLGEFIHRYSGTVGVSSITDAELARKVTTYAGSPANYSKLRLLINDMVCEVTGASSTSVQFSPSLPKAGNYNCLLYQMPHIIKNDHGKWIVRGVASDEGSGIQTIKATVKVGGTSIDSGEIIGQKITKYLGGQVSWEGEINLSSLKDGKGTLSCEVYDAQGNVYNVPNVDVIVKNKPIVVSHVTLVTDIAGTPLTFENSIINKALKNEKIDSNGDLTADFESTEFAFKNEDNSKIKVDFTGGDGTVKYQLKKDDGTKLGSLTSITSGSEIDLKDHLHAIGNSNGTPTKIILELWGESAGFTQGEDSSFAKINITTLFEALDATPPTVVALPFHWNSEEDNSLYDKSRTNGHVEIAPISSLGNNYSSVSGKVALRGFAYDNIKIDSIEARLPNTTALTVKATRQPNGTWVSDKNMVSDGAVLTVETLGADYLGYYVQWTLDWDTEKTSVGLAKEITLNANDGKTTFSDTEKTTAQTTGVTRSGRKSAQNAVFADKKPGQFVVFTNGEAQYLTRIRAINAHTVTLEDDVPTDATTVYMYAYDANKPKALVNVMPYIMNIETKLSGGAASYPSTVNRTALGSYPISRIKNGSQWENEKITVTGFNLEPSADNIFVLSDAPVCLTSDNTAVVSDAVKIAHTNVTQNAGKYTINLAAMEKSGYLSYITKTGSSYIVTANNINDNKRKSNGEPNRRNNDRLNDDRYLKLLDIYSVQGLGEVRQLDFAIHNNFLNFSAGYKDSKFSIFEKVTETTATAHNLRNSYTRYFDNCMAYNTSGTFFTVSACGDTLGVPVSNFGNGPSKFALIKGQPTEEQEEYGSPLNDTTLFLESNYNGAALNNLNRFQWPNMVVTGDDSLTKGYLSYYDSTQKLIKFRYFESGIMLTEGYEKNVGFGGTTLFPSGGDGGDSNIDQAAPKYTNNGKSYHQGFIAIAGADANSPYSAVAVTSSGTAVVTWYDAIRGALKIKYNENPGTSFSGYQAFKKDTLPPDETSDPFSLTFKLKVDGVRTQTISVTAKQFDVDGAYYGTFAHEFAYQLGKVLTEKGTGAYAEYDPILETVVVRSMQTGTGSSIEMSDFSVSTVAVLDAVPGTGSAWTEKTIDPYQAGKNPSIAIDKKDGVHIAYNATGTGDLRYAYIPSLASVAPFVSTVDSYQQTGAYTDIAIKEKTEDGKTYIIPYISYFTMSLADTRYSAKVAKLREKAIYYTGAGNVTLDFTTASQLDGAKNELLTGTWEVMHIPSAEIPVQYRVNIAVAENGSVYVAYQGEKIEYVKIE